jgi:hypothetical protein
MVATQEKVIFDQTTLVASAHGGNCAIFNFVHTTKNVAIPPDNIELLGAGIMGNNQDIITTILPTISSPALQKNRFLLNLAASMRNAPLFTSLQQQGAVWDTINYRYLFDAIEGGDRQIINFAIDYAQKDRSLRPDTFGRGIVYYAYEEALVIQESRDDTIPITNEALLKKIIDKNRPDLLLPYINPECVKDFIR